MNERDRIPPPGTRVELHGGGGRRDYGPKGCAEFVAVPVLAVLVLLVRRCAGGRR